MSQTDACEECANKCMLIHKKNRNASSIVSSCVKVVISDQFLTFLPLPPSFAPRVASLVDQQTWVEDSSGRKWTLTLSTVKGLLGFGKGWASFSFAHGIKFGDILIIHCILDSHFIVQIFGQSGCEKLIFPSLNNTTPNKSCRKNKNKERSEEDGVTLYDDVFTSETSKTKAVGEKEIGSSNAKDATDNHTVCEDAFKKHLESARDVEIPDQPHNGFSQDEQMLLDFDANRNYEFVWTPEIDQKRNNVEKKENGISTKNSTELQSDLPVSVSNVINRIINEMHTPVQPGAQITTSDPQINGNNGKSILKEPASAICRFHGVKGTTGSKSESSLKVVKNEPVDQESLQATCLVKPNSESFFEIRRGLPTTSREEAKEKVVVLRDSSGRKWPVRYHHKDGLKGLGYGWRSFFKANGIKCGDECVFTLEDQLQSLYRVQVIHK